MKIERAQKWSDKVAALLAPAMAHDPTYGLGELSSSINSGDIGLFIVREQGEIEGAFALRFEDYSQCSEMIVMAAGSRSGAPLSRSVVPFIRDLARAQRLDFIRAHVPDPRWQAILTRYGFKTVEAVMRCEVS